MNLLSRLSRPAASRNVSRTRELIPLSGQTTFNRPDLGDWYQPVMLAPSMLGEVSTSVTCLREVISIVKRLEPDDYVRYLLAYYTAGLDRFGASWRYTDIVTMLLAAAKLVSPKEYLEVGVRRGRSMAMIAATHPACHIVGFDLWAEDYAGMPNPGADFVRRELARLGYRGKLDLITGDSHVTLPQYFGEHPEAYFDLVTVDGDHSEKGAEQDLRDIMPRIKIGGVLVFDDICHPAHPYLSAIWQHVVVSDPRFVTWQYTELGYGVACAIRRSV